MHKFISKYGFFVLFGLLACTIGNLHVTHNLPNNLKEISAAEIIEGTDMLWMIEDQGNAPKVYGFNLKSGDLTRTITVNNVKNKDWEDLTSDKDGNIYIGDFGNNSNKRMHFTIYKIEDIFGDESIKDAKKIEFTVPKKIKKQDFEGFFLYNHYFYIFSKNDKKGTLIKVPNTLGEHAAEIVTNFNLKGKKDAITGADISEDGTQVVLLNHEKVWLLSNYKEDDFFSGTIEVLPFNHSSQKEGVCFAQKNELLITDERNGTEGGNIYSFNLN